MDWRIKGLTQKVIGVLPSGLQINDLMQQHLGGLRNFRGHVANRVMDDWVVLAGYMKELGLGLSERRYLEIGTGWLPVLPICYALADVRRIVTYDLVRHLNTRLTFQMLTMLDPFLPAIAEAGDRPLSEVASALKELRDAKTLEELLLRAGIEYRAPADVTASEVPDCSVDVVFSNNVLEHVPPDDIARMMDESHRILGIGGLVMHCVNCGDHYAHFDRTITQINYLTYSDREWAFWNNRFLYQNRLRPVDFVRLVEKAGFDVLLLKVQPRPELLASLPQMKIAAEFSQYPAEELCCTSVGFVARKR